jgi:hypothetical protein
MQGVPERQLLLGRQNDGLLAGRLYFPARLRDSERSYLIADADAAQLGCLSEVALSLIIQTDHEGAGCSSHLAPLG